MDMLSWKWLEGAKLKNNDFKKLVGAPVAQLDRASAFEAESRPFESGRAHQ